MTLTRHKYKSWYGQCRCLWCGSYRGGAEDYCKMTHELRTFAREYSRTQGRSWRRRLFEAIVGDYEGHDEYAQLRKLFTVGGVLQVMRLEKQMAKWPVKDYVTPAEALARSKMP